MIRFLFLSFFTGAFCVKAQSISEDYLPIANNVKNETLKKQMLTHIEIANEIASIFDASKKKEAYLNEMVKKEAAEYRRENKLSATTPVQIATPRLSRKDSVALKLYKQDSLLFIQYKKFENAFVSYGEKLSKSDEESNFNFYDKLILKIDDLYVSYFASKRQSKVVQRADYSTNGVTPLLFGCENVASDKEACFSSVVRKEVEQNYEVPDFLNYYTATLRSKLLFRITKEGKFEALEVVKTSNSFFVDNLSLEIGKKLFRDKKAAPPQTAVYIGQLPMGFVFD